MINKLRGYTQLAVSVVMLCAITFTIAIVSYQVFSPHGRIFQSLSGIWENHPVLLVIVGGLLFATRHWINGYHPGPWLSNGLFYAAGCFGIVVGVQYLI